MKPTVEKRKHPRVDISRGTFCKIRVFGINTRPVEGQVINLSLGGVAFISHWEKVAKTAKRFATRVEIQLPNGVIIDANTTLLRVKPEIAGEECLCVYELTEMNKSDTSRLKRFIQ